METTGAKFKKFELPPSEGSAMKFIMVILKWLLIWIMGDDGRNGLLPKASTSLIRGQNTLRGPLR
jgi:hypothetical protein